MMRNIIYAALAAVLLASGAQARGQGELKNGAKAPNFTAKGTDGKSHTLGSLTAKGPVFLYFIKEDCPINAQAVAYYQRLAQAYPGKARLVGVINANPDLYKQWNARHKTTFLTLFDPDKRIIGAYQAERSPWTVQVDAKAKVVKTWRGYSVPDLNAIGGAMAKANGVTVKKLDTRGAPKDTRYG